jgi:hypothetical protein
MGHQGTFKIQSILDTKAQRYEEQLVPLSLLTSVTWVSHLSIEVILLTMHVF